MVVVSNFNQLFNDEEIQDRDEHSDNHNDLSPSEYTLPDGKKLYISYVDGQQYTVIC